VPELRREEATPPSQDGNNLVLSGPFAAKFVEVRIDRDLGLIRVARVTQVVDAGRILNEKTARTQIIGGTIGGIGQGLLEEPSATRPDASPTPRSATTSSPSTPTSPISTSSSSASRTRSPPRRQGRRRDRPRRHGRRHR
jgi:hypothetical protein